MRFVLLLYMMEFHLEKISYKSEKIVTWEKTSPNIKIIEEIV